MKRSKPAKERASIAMDAYAEDHERNVLATLPNLNEPTSWADRVERLYRREVVPRLEAKAELTEVERRVLDKARAFLKAADRRGGTVS